MAGDFPDRPRGPSPTVWVVMATEARDAEVAVHLRRQGFTVYLEGLADPRIPPVGEMQAVLGPQAVLVGPVTGLRLGSGPGQVAPEWLQRLAGGGWLAAGRLEPSLVDAARRHGVRVVEYLRDPAFLWRNAALTAEAALRLAIGEHGYGLWQSAAAVIGYGHVGSVLAARLTGLADRVRVLDRRREARAQAEALGLAAYPLDPAALLEVDVAFNTVPAPILTPTWFSPRCRMVWDLASYPGGLAPAAYDHPLVRERYRSALGLPGKVTPASAGLVVARVLGECVQGDA